MGDGWIHFFLLSRCSSVCRPAPCTSLEWRTCVAGDEIDIHCSELPLRDTAEAAEEERSSNSSSTSDHGLLRRLGSFTVA